jgi:hypothetical protein
MHKASHANEWWSVHPHHKGGTMFNEIYMVLQQGRVLQHRWVEEAGQAQRWWLAAILRRKRA